MRPTGSRTTGTPATIPEIGVCRGLHGAYESGNEGRPVSAKIKIGVGSRNPADASYTTYTET